MGASLLALAKSIYYCYFPSWKNCLFRLIECTVLFRGPVVVMVIQEMVMVLMMMW